MNIITVNNSVSNSSSYNAKTLTSTTRFLITYEELLQVVVTANNEVEALNKADKDFGVKADLNFTQPASLVTTYNLANLNASIKTITIK